MGRKVFLSFLGMGNYTPVKYATNDDHESLIRTRFVQEAIIRQHCLNFSEEDRIYIALTDGAKSINWKDGKYLKEEELPNGLQRILEKYKLGNRLEVIDKLPNGKEEEEMWRIFDRIYAKLEPSDEVIFDITHAFRSLPFLAMALFNFAKFTKKVELKNILYGAFDSLNEDGTAQVWDLLPYMILQEYAVGAAMFTRYGKGDFLSDVIKERNSNIDYKQPEYKPLKSVQSIAEGFSEFANLLSINQIPEALRVAHNFPSKVKKLKDTGRTPMSVKPFLQILDDIASYIEPLNDSGGNLFSKEGFDVQLQLMDKCIESKNYAQAISICRELIVSYISEMSGYEDIFNYTGTRKKIENFLNTLSRVQRGSEVVLDETQIELAKLWDKITEIRNVINHAFMDKGKKEWDFKLASGKALESCILLKEIITAEKIKPEHLRLPVKKCNPLLLNLSNHPSSSWPESQLRAATNQYQTVEDLPFPQINPEWDEDQIEQLAEEYEIKIRKINPQAVHLMGEMTFTFKLVSRLKSIGIPCIASTTERIATEDSNGNKTSVFQFVRFRMY